MPSSAVAEARTYESWKRMITRCYNRRSRQYKNYGRKGICVAEAWLEYSQFREDMGLRPRKHGLARLDKTRDYSLDNCRWMPTNLAPRRDGASVNGEEVEAIAERLGISYQMAYYHYVTKREPVP